ncbi:unnamed protein product [Sphagnum balticum]
MDKIDENRYRNILFILLRRELPTQRAYPDDLQNRDEVSPTETDMHPRERTERNERTSSRSIQTPDLLALAKKAPSPCHFRPPSQYG